MRMPNRDERAEYLKEIINNYSRNPEYTNNKYTKQEAIEALNEHYKKSYLNLD